MSKQNVENLSPQVIRRVSKELSELLINPPEGIKVCINDEDITDIKAVIEGPIDTPYYGGAFKVRLILTKDFPSTSPKALFITKIFHPNVSRTGEICVNTLKRDWEPNLGLKHILLTIKCLLIVPNPESALNEEAGKLLLERYDDYFLRAKMMTEIHAQRIHEKEFNTNNNNNTNSNSNSNGSSGNDLKDPCSSTKTNNDNNNSNTENSLNNNNTNTSNNLNSNSSNNNNTNSTNNNSNNNNNRKINNSTSNNNNSNSNTSDKSKSINLKSKLIKDKKKALKRL